MPTVSRMLTLCLGVVMAAAVTACGAGGVKLDDATVTKYVKAYTAIKKVSPGIAASLRQDKADAAEAQAGFDKIDQAIKSAGFTGYPEFVKVNAAVAWAFSQAQAGAFVAETGANVSKGEAQIDAALKNPHLPEAAKAQMRAHKAKLHAEYTKNKGWADVAMNLTSQLTDKDSIEVVKRHRGELEAAFKAR